MIDDNPYKIKIVIKGWGFEKWIVNSEEYCGKLLVFNKNKKCSWHYHKLKDEVFYVEKGKILLKYSDKEDINLSSSIILNEGDNFHIYRGLKHQIIALKKSVIYEFSTTHYDSDSYRILKGD